MLVLACVLSGCAAPPDAEGAAGVEDLERDEAFDQAPTTGSPFVPGPPPGGGPRPKPTLANVAMDVSYGGVIFEEWQLRVDLYSDRNVTGMLRVTEQHTDQGHVGWLQTSLAVQAVALANGTWQREILPMPPLGLAAADISIEYRGTDGAWATRTLVVRSNATTGVREAHLGDAWASHARSTPFSTAGNVSIDNQQLSFRFHGDADHWMMVDVSFSNGTRPVQVDLVLPYPHLETRLLLVQGPDMTARLDPGQGVSWTLRSYEPAHGIVSWPEIVLRTGPALDATVLCGRADLAGWTFTGNPIAGCGDSTRGLWDAGPWRLVLDEATPTNATFTLVHPGLPDYAAQTVWFEGPLGVGWGPSENPPGNVTFTVPWVQAEEGRSEARITVGAQEGDERWLHVWVYDVAVAPVFAEPARSLRPFPHLGGRQG